MNPAFSYPAPAPQTGPHDFRQMVEAAETTVIFTTDAKGYFTYVNPAVLPMLGYAPLDVIGQHYTQYIAPASREKVVAFYYRQYADHIPKTVMEYALTTASGQEHWVEQTVVLLTQENEITGFLGYLRDIHDRHQAQETLAHERNLLRTLIDLLPDYIFVKDREGRFIAVNESEAQHVRAASTDALIGKTDFDAFPAELAQQYRDDEERILETGQPLIDKEEPSLTADGESAWHLTSKVPLRDLQNNIVGIVGLSRDITQRKMQESALYQARIELEKRVGERTAELSKVNAALVSERNLLQTLIDHLPDFIYVKDKACRFVVGNLSVAAVMRTTPTDLIGKTDFDFYDQALAQQYFSDDSMVLQTGVPLINVEEENVDRVTGFQRWVLTNKVPLRDEAGNVTGLVGIGRDISTRKKAEDIVKQQQAFLRQLIDTAPNLIFVKDAEGRYTLSNEAHAQVVGAVSSDDVVGKTDVDLHPPGTQREQYRQDDLEVLRTMKPKLIPEEIVVNPRNGDLLYVQTIKVPVMAQDGSGYQILGIATDITERKRAERQSLELAVERERVRLLADFIRDVSHDFRTPLSTINTSAYLLDRADSPDKKQQHVHMIQRQTAQLSRLVDALMTMTRLDSEAGFHFDMAQVNSLVNLLVTRGNSLATAKSLCLDVSAASTLKPVWADVVELDRALTEIFNNAIYYTPDGGTIKISTFEEETSVVIEIADSGVGIQHEDIAHIFDRFYRADKARSTETGGIGLGLSIAQKIVEQHGGNITVQSQVGIGTTFRIYLPIT